MEFISGRIAQIPVGLDVFYAALTAPLLYLFSSTLALFGKSFAPFAGFPRRILATNVFVASMHLVRGSFHHLLALLWTRFTLSKNTPTRVYILHIAINFWKN